MSRIKKYLGLATLVAIVAALGISSAAFAQSTTTPTPTAPAPPEMHRGDPGGRFLRSQAAQEAAAEALGMTTDELSTELQEGKTLEDIAEAQGVDIDTVKAAIKAAELTETKEAIAQAVTDGTITQAKADWLLEGLDNGYWSAGRGGFGFGMGPGGPGDHGGPPPNGTPPDGNDNGAATASGSSS
jgi:hypothetical protein